MYRTELHKKPHAPIRDRRLPPVLIMLSNAGSQSAAWRTSCSPPTQIHYRPQHVALRCHATPPGMDDKRLFIFGLGYTTLGLANMLCQEDGWRITAAVRDTEVAARLQQCQAPNWQTVEFDPCSSPGRVSPQLLEALEQASYVISSIPPVGLPLYDPVLSAQLKALKQVASSGNLRWLGYLSSTGVYGDYGGDWVTETSETRAVSARGYVRREAEEAWGKAARSVPQLPLHVFRLGGIYGPGRSLVSSVSQAAQPSPPPADSASKARRGQQKYISRIHVYDICQALRASMFQPRTSSDNPVAVYNLVDDEPAPRREVAEYIRARRHPSEEGVTAGQGPGVSVQSRGCGAAGSGRLQVHPHPAPMTVQSSQESVQGSQCSRPTQAGAQAEAPADAQAEAPRGAGAALGRRGGTAAEVVEEKRVRNDKMKSELGVTLRFPTYREGVDAIMRGALEPFTAEDLRWLGLEV